MSALETELIERRNQFNERLRAEGLGGDYHAHVFRPPSDKRHWYQNQIREAARTLNYAVDTHEYRDWVRVSIVHEHEQRATVLVVSVHPFGRTFKGVLAALAFVEVIDSSAGGEQRQGPFVATDRAFTFGYLDAKEHVLVRLREWLQPAWLSELKTWQDTL